MFKTTLYGASMLALVSVAHAQTLPAATPATGTTSAATAKAPKLTLGEQLYDHGVSVSLGYTGEAAANPWGGKRQGADYAGQVALGADFDMNKIANWQGATIHVTFTERHGRNLAADYIGNNTSVQEIYGTQNVHLANFTVEQKLLDNRLDITAGRTVANIAFLGSPLYCLFQSNSACGNPTFVFKDSNFTYWPASSWGGDAKFLFTPDTYIHAGVYEVSPEDKTIGNHGFSWSGKGDTGVIVPAELGYTPEAGALYAVGGWYDTGAYTDPLNNSEGTPALLSNTPYAQHHDRSGMFVRFNQDIMPNLAVFGVFMTKLSGHVDEKQYYELGIVKTAPFVSRPQDKIGFVVNDQEFTSNFIDNIKAGRASVGESTGGIPHREIMMELHYDAQINPSITFEPNVQYIINPDQSSEPTRDKSIPNAFVVGVKFTVDIAKLIGLAPPQ